MLETFKSTDRADRRERRPRRTVMSLLGMSRTPFPTQFVFSRYVEYLNLISQTVEEETTEAIEDEPVNPVTNPLSKIISVIKDLVAIIKAAVAFIKADMPGLPFSFKK